MGDGRPDMTSQTLTVLFTDIVGSTELLSRVGDRTAERLRLSHFATLREHIERARGREVKNLGDGVMAAFRLPAAGLNALCRSSAPGRATSATAHKHRPRSGSG